MSSRFGNFWFRIVARRISRLILGVSWSRKFSEYFVVVEVYRITECRLSLLGLWTTKPYAPTSVWLFALHSVVSFFLNISLERNFFGMGGMLFLQCLFFFSFFRENRLQMKQQYVMQSIWESYHISEAVLPQRQTFQLYLRKRTSKNEL